MIDPKQNLTRFSQIYAAKQRARIPALAGARRAAFRDIGIAEVIANTDAVGEGDAGLLQNLQSMYSISSAEELVALKRIDERMHTTLLQDLGIQEAMVDQMESSITSASGVGEEMSDWEGYEQLQYEFWLRDRP